MLVHDALKILLPLFWCNVWSSTYLITEQVRVRKQRPFESSCRGTHCSCPMYHGASGIHSGMIFKLLMQSTISFAHTHTLSLSLTAGSCIQNAKRFERRWQCSKGL